MVEKNFLKTGLVVSILVLLVGTSLPQVTGGINIANPVSAEKEFVSEAFTHDEPTTLPESPIFPDLNNYLDVKITLKNQIMSIHNELTINSYDEDIVELIQQINESMVLGYIENLTAFGPRETGTPACDAAGVYIYNEFKNMGFEVRYHNWTYSGEHGSNIEATLPGLNESTDHIYIICGHYDSVSASPGADDNGAGTAAVLSAAQV